MPEISNGFVWGAIGGATVTGWLAALFFARFMRVLIQAAHVGVPLKLKDGKHYHLVELSQLEELQSYRKVMIRDLHSWSAEQLRQPAPGAAP